MEVASFPVGVTQKDLLVVYSFGKGDSQLPVTVRVKFKFEAIDQYFSVDSPFFRSSSLNKDVGVKVRIDY